MTISTTTTATLFVGNGVTTVFPFTFRILAATDLVVTKRLDGTLVDTTLVYPADYSVSGVGNATGGSITLAVAPATGDLLAIERDMVRTQSTSIRNNGSYFPDTHETVFDRLTMFAQEDETALGRTFSLAKTLNPASYNMELPAPTTGQLLGWSADGLTNVTVSPSSVVLPGEGRTTDTLSTYLANNYVYNVLDYEADPTATVDSASAQAAAISAANTGGGGIIFHPRGQYKSSSLVVPVNQFKTIVLQGAGMRHTIVYPTTAGAVGVLFGASSPDASGTFTNQTQYCGMEDMSVNGSLLTTNADSIGVQFTEMQKGWLKNVIIESFTKTGTTGSIGLYLRGSTTTGVASAAAPHTWRCRFTNVVVATTVRPLILENADENDFLNCNFALPLAVTASADTLFAIDIIQGRNNRWYGLLLSGDTTTPDGGSTYTYRAAYDGIRFKQPTKGDVLGNVAYGLVAEGFNKPIVFGGNLVKGCGVRDYNSSINAVTFTDSAPQAGTGCFVDSPYHNINYRNGPAQYTDALTFAANATTPDVSGGNLFATNNSGPIGITDFVNGHSGQSISIQLGGNDTLTNGAHVHLPGAGNYTSTGVDTALFANMNGVWNLVGIAAAAGYPLTRKVTADQGDANVTLTLATARCVKFNTALTTNRTVTSPAAGSFNGDTFRVVRMAGASGASTLTAFGKALAVSQWVEGTWDGSTWIESAFGSL